jgi:Fe-S oxidoreductase
VGCAGAYDERGQQIARAFAKILNKADINFAVLGINENCTGDSARRAGNEYLFSAIAEANIELLNSVNVEKILVTCPHCLQTLKNDYQQFGGNFEVIHHSEFIKDLINSRKLNITSNDKKKITYHDPCYLGRHNEIFSEPRFVLKSTGADLIEMARTRNRSFCCGAGGANMWKEEEPGTEAVRHNRLKEAQTTGADTICTSCPFCITMLTDAQKELDAAIQVKDIAEVVAEKI